MQVTAIKQHRYRNIIREVGEIYEMDGRSHLNLYSALGWVVKTPESDKKEFFVAKKPKGRPKTKVIEKVAPIIETQVVAEQEPVQEPVQEPLQVVQESVEETTKTGYSTKVMKAKSWL